MNEDDIAITWIVSCNLLTSFKFLGLLISIAIEVYFLMLHE